MKVIIAEKPKNSLLMTEVMEKILKKKSEKKAGYYIVDDYVITHCFGHMLTVDESELPVKWTWENLPFNIKNWKKIVPKDKQAQYKVISDFIKKSDTIIHLGDADDEGQLIVDEILHKEGIIDLFDVNKPSKKTVKRLMPTEETPEGFTKAFNTLTDNKKWQRLSLSAEARCIADMIFGFNLSRAYTIQGQTKYGYDGVLSVGRVQTPILGLIVQRDIEIEQHKKSYFYLVRGIFDKVSSVYQTTENDVDSTGKITVKENAIAIKDSVLLKDAVLKVTTTRKTEYAPLGYSLLTLQIDASKKYKIKPDKVLEITQTLRDKRLITYNRSDCEFLNDSMFEDATVIKNAIISNANNVLQDKSYYTSIDKQLDMKIKGRIYNDKKVTAHHAIIPTQTFYDGKLSNDEERIYDLIAKRFLLQFLPSCDYDETVLEYNIDGKIFKTSQKNIINEGYRAFITQEKADDNDDKENNQVEKIDFRTLKNGSVKCSDIIIEEKVTKPKKKYTMDTLLMDFRRVADYVKDPKIKKLLKEKDKSKGEGEKGGLGTPATRSNIIANLIDRGFIVDGKILESTKLGRDFILSLSSTLTRPDMTALWHEQQLEIQEGKESIFNFLDEVYNNVAEEVKKAKSSSLKIALNAIACPTCKKGILKKIKAKNDKFYWICSLGRECNTIFNDDKGKPQLEKREQKLSKHNCKLCNKPLVFRKGSKGDFWGCSGYPKCKQTYPDDKGRPIYEKSVVQPSSIHTCMLCGSALIKRKSAKGDFWGCSKFPACKQTYPDDNGKPLYRKD